MIYNRYSTKIDWLIDLIAPNRCPFCDEFLPYNALVCDECEKELESVYTKEKCCGHCGKKHCMCSEIEAYYSKCYSACFYENLAKRGVHNLKFYSSINAGVYFADVIHSKLDEDKAFDKIDYAIPVPMNKKRLAIRGYNQAKIIANRIVKGTDIAVLDNILARRYSKKAQHTLSAQDRAKAAKEQYYALDSKVIFGKTILLCDDVMTTGSTVNACAKVLVENGAKEVIVAVCTVT